MSVAYVSRRSAKRMRWEWRRRFFVNDDEFIFVYDIAATTTTLAAGIQPTRGTDRIECRGRQRASGVELEHSERCDRL